MDDRVASFFPGDLPERVSENLAALRGLVAPLADPRVGGVSGELLIDDGEDPAGADGDSPVAEGVGLYWRYEKWLRQRESDVRSTLGATGAIYALRRSAWRPLPPGTLLDDVLAPMRAVLQGCRVVFTPAARALLDAQRNFREVYRTYVSSRADYFRSLYRYYSTIGKQVTQ